MLQAMKSEVIFKTFNTQPGLRQPSWVLSRLSYLQRLLLIAWETGTLHSSSPHPRGSTALPHTRPEPGRITCHFTGGETETRVGRIAQGHINSGRAGHPGALYYTGVGVWTLGDFLCPAPIFAHLDQCSHLCLGPPASILIPLPQPEAPMSTRVREHPSSVREPSMAPTSLRAKA